MTRKRLPRKERIWKVTYKLPNNKVKVEIVKRTIISRYVWTHAPEDFVSFDYEAISEVEDEKSH